MQGAEWEQPLLLTTVFLWKLSSSFLEVGLELEVGRTKFYQLVPPGGYAERSWVPMISPIHRKCVVLGIILFGSLHKFSDN